jgi:hypothetical protein
MAYDIRTLSTLATQARQFFTQSVPGDRGAGLGQHLLECLLRRYCPPHTELVFDYSAIPQIGTTDLTVPGTPWVLLL